MKSIVVSVDYADLLALTLPRNAPHFDQTLVVTTREDEATQTVARTVPNVEVFCTDAFHRHGDPFNKGLALEEAFDVTGRDGWFCHWDADIVLPPDAAFAQCEPGNLYTARRRICRDPNDWKDDNWSRFPICKEADFVAGYLQVFHGSDPVLQHRPWYPTHWIHAGGSDTDFCQKWQRDRQRLFPFTVLHLGPPFMNWFGRASKRLDGSVPDGAAERIRRIQQMHRDRHRFGFSREQRR